MDTRVGGEELLDSTDYRTESSGRGSGVQRYIRTFQAIDAGHERPVADQRNRGSDHYSPIFPAPVSVPVLPRLDRGRSISPTLELKDAATSSD